MDLVEELFKKLEDPDLPGDYTIDNFYKEMGIPKKHRTDFGTAAIFKQMLERYPADRATNRRSSK